MRSKFLQRQGLQFRSASQMQQNRSIFRNGLPAYPIGTKTVPAKLGFQRRMHNPLLHRMHSQQSCAGLTEHAALLSCTILNSGQCK